MKRSPMRNRFVLFSSALIVFTVAIFLSEATDVRRADDRSRNIAASTAIDCGIVLPVGGLHSQAERRWRTRPDTHVLARA